MTTDRSGRGLEPLHEMNEYHLVVTINEETLTWAVDLDLPPTLGKNARVRQSGSFVTVDDGRKKAKAFARFALEQYVFGGGT